jgi:hypothetical protein
MSARVYAKVSSRFWTGETGKALRKRGPEGVVVGLYLISSPHSNMLGLYYQPILYMAHETGLGLEGASKGLQSCIEAGFCSYDENTEMVFVREMAAWQIGDGLKSGDKQCVGVRKAYEGLPENPFLGAFFKRYGKAFHIPTNRHQDASPKQAPSKPLRSQEQEQEQEQEQDPPTVEAAEGPSIPAAPPPPSVALATPTPAKPERGTRLSKEWQLPKAWGEWALEKYPQWTAQKVRDEALKFRNSWTAKTRDATKLDWYATWQNWCMSDIAHRDDPRPLNGTHIGKQAAIEEHNRIVGEAWERSMEAQDASH